jgi:ActR/RegA family two-component response regulator
VVDEDQSAARTLAKVLQARGFTVMEANRGPSRHLDAARHHHPELGDVAAARARPVATLRGVENVLFVYQ